MAPQASILISRQHRYFCLIVRAVVFVRNVSYAEVGNDWVMGGR